MAIHRARFLLPALLLSCLATLGGPSPAQAMDAAGRCLHGKLAASRMASSSFVACRLRHLADEDRFARCVDRKAARAARLLEQVSADLATEGFACPGSVDSLGLAKGSGWPAAIVNTARRATPAPCVESSLRASRIFAAAYSRCVEHAGLLDVDKEDGCVSKARAAMLRRWAAGGEACGPDAALQAMERIEAEVDETAQRLVVQCGDGNVGGREECDDGNDASGDGCSADCRREQCLRGSDGEVRCTACPSDSVPTEDGLGCRCPKGFAGEAGACADIDECSDPATACPEGRPCVNLQGSWACAVACTADALVEALASCGAPSGAIAFDCRDTVIRIPADSDVRSREVPCNDLVVDGAGRGISFEMDPPCWQLPLDAAQCPAGLEPDGSCACPDVDSGAQFLQLRGDRNVVRDVTVRGFFEGIPVRGRDNVVEDVRFERQCDDSFGSVGSGVGNLFRRIDASRGCDKCSEDSGNLADTDPDPRVRAHWNAVFEDVRFSGCRTPVRAALAGRFLLDRVAMRAGEDADFPCDGPRFSSGTADDRVVLSLQDSLLEDCRHGLRLGRGTEALVRGTRIAGCELRAVRAAAGAQVTMEGCTLASNGGGGSAETGFGGVAVLEGSTADLGGGLLDWDGAPLSSKGENAICDNRGPSGRRRDVQNDSGFVLPARGNWWCSAAVAPVRLMGDVDTEPVLDRAPLRVRGVLP